MTLYRIINGQDQLEEKKDVVCWFSGGITSAVACFYALKEFGDKCVIATIRLESEDDDNWRFMHDCENLLFHRKVVQLQHREFKDPVQVFKKKKMFQMQGVGAPCTMILKKQVREAFEKDYRLFKQVFGYDSAEKSRAERFLANQPEIELVCPLIDFKISKTDCFDFLKLVGIDPPKTYLQFNNANCLKTGCIKAGKGYWNKYRSVYPDRFERMAELEEEFHSYYRSRGLKSRPTIIRS